MNLDIKSQPSSNYTLLFTGNNAGWTFHYLFKLRSNQKSNQKMFSTFGTETTNNLIQDLSGPSSLVERGFGGKIAQEFLLLPHLIESYLSNILIFLSWLLRKVFTGNSKSFQNGLRALCGQHDCCSTNECFHFYLIARARLDF